MSSKWLASCNGFPMIMLNCEGHSLQPGVVDIFAGTLDASRGGSLKPANMQEAMPTRFAATCSTRRSPRPLGHRCGGCRCSGSWTRPSTRRRRRCMPHPAWAMHWVVCLAADAVPVKPCPRQAEEKAVLHSSSLDSGSCFCLFFQLIVAAISWCGHIRSTGCGACPSPSDTHLTQVWAESHDLDHRGKPRPAPSGSRTQHEQGGSHGAQVAGPPRPAA